MSIVLLAVAPSTVTVAVISPTAFPLPAAGLVTSPVSGSIAEFVVFHVTSASSKYEISCMSFYTHHSVAKRQQYTNIVPVLIYTDTN